MGKNKDKSNQYRSRCQALLLEKKKFQDWFGAYWARHLALCEEVSSLVYPGPMTKPMVDVIQDLINQLKNPFQPPPKKGEEPDAGRISKVGNGGNPISDLSNAAQNDEHS